MKRGGKTFISIEYCIGIILILGGVMGVVKGMFPEAHWLSFRYLITRTATYEVNEMPLYARFYGIVMACMEIVAASFIFSGRQLLKKYVIFVLVINAIGCAVAALCGDLFAIISLLIRVLVILYLVKKLKYLEQDKSKVTA